MDQIRENKIIGSEEVEQNPFFAPPRDLIISTKEFTNAGKASISSQTTVQEQDTFTIGAGALDYGQGSNDAAQAPSTPAIMGIKEQIVNIGDDGKATIDVILIVEDIKGVTEYDIRVAKNAGNL